MTKRIDLKALAERGAALKVAELRAEIDSILSAFPGLRRNAGRTSNGAPGAVAGAKAGASTGRARQRRSRSMSAAQRKAVSARMSAYWAERRKAKTPSKAK